MKKILLSVALFAALQIFNRAEAQPGIGIHIGVGVAPAWIPPGYADADYYYLPDIQAYYCVPQRQFIYLDGGRWIYSAGLPARYHGYDLYGGYKVALHGSRPYLRDDYYRERYGRGAAYYDRGGVSPVYRNSAMRYSGREGYSHGRAYGHRR